MEEPIDDDEVEDEKTDEEKLDDDDDATVEEDTEEDKPKTKKVHTVPDKTARCVQKFVLHLAKSRSSLREGAFVHV